MRHVLLCAAALVALPGSGLAQADDAESVRIALIYHQLTGDPLDVSGIAGSSAAVRRVSNFDRPEALAAEIGRLERLLAAADAAEVFVMQINDRISEYDHDNGEFSISLFQPGYHIPLTVFGQQYQVVFANAESARAIPMPREEAREFDRRLNAAYRNVLTEVRFRVTGQGDPAGAVTGARVVRAELVGARVLDTAGRVIHTAAVMPVAALEADAPVFDPRTVDVAGFRVGVSVDDMVATLERLFGAVERGTPGNEAPAGYAGILRVNSMGCLNLPGRREARPGAVCITAHFDQEEKVRAIRVERLFPPLQAEVVRQALVARYGPVASAGGSSGFTLGWGPEVDARFGATRALTASYMGHRSSIGVGTNRIPDVRVVLHLVDAEWASRQTQ